MASYFDTSIEFIKGVGTQRASLIREELGISTIGNLIQHYPFRHEDRTKMYTIKEISLGIPYIQLRGKITRISKVGIGRKKRLTMVLRDATGSIELSWFQGVSFIEKKIMPGIDYLVFGKPTQYGKKMSMVHPELEAVEEEGKDKLYLQPVYPLTEKLRSCYLNNRFFVKIQREVSVAVSSHIRETLPARLMQDKSLVSRKKALQDIHFPISKDTLSSARRRLKFEELFYIQLQLLKLNRVRKISFPGAVYKNTEWLKNFYEQHLEFSLTEAQKRVIKEIYRDLKSGKQMNRLLQGDVGSGKTIVAFICMLPVLESEAQVVLMAPTEILAQQHYMTLKKYADYLNISVGLLTRSVKPKERHKLHHDLLEKNIKILVGTHAVVEEIVRFDNLGLAIIDEQHRFGVAQRSRLWEKKARLYPHILVMTATPIPRTLAMTLYGDLDMSTIDELPKGRKAIKTIHRYDSHRLRVNQFIRDQIALGRQVYIVYPLIEESKSLNLKDLKDLKDGYESIERAFPEIPVGILYGQMTSEAKEFEMKQFVKGQTKIMVATTVIEVGVDIPNASVMIIESAERFGLSQLHQLRGRVGRGTDQSYCILMTDYKLSKEAITRIKTMTETNNGFRIAEVDLNLRGPGDMTGTQQSGVLDLLIADLSTDGLLLLEARNAAMTILDGDVELKKPENRPIAEQIESLKQGTLNWSRIS